MTVPKPKGVRQKMQESKVTTSAGLVTTGVALVSALLPQNVREICMDGIMKSDSPILVGSLLVAGLALTIIGPSLTHKKP